MNRRVAAAVGGQGQARVREVQRDVGQSLMRRRRHRHLLPTLGAATAIPQQRDASLEQAAPPEYLVRGCQLLGDAPAQQRDWQGERTHCWCAACCPRGRGLRTRTRVVLSGR